MKKKQKPKEMNDIVNRLNILISLELIKNMGKISKKEARKYIKFLYENGIVDYKEIASILKMRYGSVANVLTILKKKNVKKTKN